MDIFSEAEGLSGENLGSTLLSYLIFNSHEIRDSVLALLSDNSPVGPLTYSSHFACRTEYPTTHSTYGRGRLDILIQLDDVVIGIENKFFAQFQEGQPQKYYETLEFISHSLGEINHTKSRALLFILCPESRKNEAYERIKGIENISVITWEEILDSIDRAEPISNPTSQILAQEFCKYLKRNFSFIDDFSRKAVHLKRSFPDYGSPYQGELVGKLWSLFPSPGGRLSNGKTWVGYYFYTDPEIKEKGWFGFILASDIEGASTNNKAELIVASTYAPDLSPSLRRVKLKNDNFIGAPGKSNYWIIEFDSSWNSIELWREELSPFWQAVSDDIT